MPSESGKLNHAQCSTRDEPLLYLTMTKKEAQRGRVACPVTQQAPALEPRSFPLKKFSGVLTVP